MAARRLPRVPYEHITTATHPMHDARVDALVMNLQNIKVPQTYVDDCCLC